jgi:hypothetical protein
MRDLEISGLSALTGLSPNTSYRLRMFYRQWDANEANTRFTDITFNEETGTGRPASFASTRTGAKTHA